MKNYVKQGDSVALTAPAAATSGVPFVVGPAGFKLVAVPQASVASGESVECVIEGVVELTKDAADNFVAGEPCYWDDSAKKADKSAATLVPFGFCVETTATNAVVMKVKLNGVPGVPV